MSACTAPIAVAAIQRVPAASSHVGEAGDVVRARSRSATTCAAASCDPRRRARRCRARRAARPCSPRRPDPCLPCWNDHRRRRERRRASGEPILLSRASSARATRPRSDVGSRRRRSRRRSCCRSRTWAPRHRRSRAPCASQVVTVFASLSKIHRPDAVGGAAAVARRRRIEHVVDEDRADDLRVRPEGTSPAESDRCRSAGSSRGPCRRSRSRTTLSLPPRPSAICGPRPPPRPWPPPNPPPGAAGAAPAGGAPARPGASAAAARPAGAPAPPAAPGAPAPAARPPRPPPTGADSGVAFVNTGRPDAHAAGLSTRSPDSAPRTCDSGRSRSSRRCRRCRRRRPAP